MARIGDLLAALLEVMVKTNGGRVRVPPRQRPVTALERARERRRQEQHERLVARLLPNRGDEGS